MQSGEGSRRENFSQNAKNGISQQSHIRVLKGRIFDQGSFESVGRALGVSGNSVSKAESDMMEGLPRVIQLFTQIRGAGIPQLFERFIHELTAHLGKIDQQRQSEMLEESPAASRERFLTWRRTQPLDKQYTDDEKIGLGFLYRLDWRIVSAEIGIRQLTAWAQARRGQTFATLIGETFNIEMIVGSDSIQTPGCK